MADGNHAELKRRLIAAFKSDSEQSTQEFGKLALRAVEVLSEEELDEISAHFEAFIDNLDGDALESLAQDHAISRMK